MHCEPLPTSQVMKKSEFKRQGLATLKAGGRARSKRLEGPRLSEDPKAAGPATGTEFFKCSFQDTRNVQMRSSIKG